MIEIDVHATGTKGIQECMSFFQIVVCAAAGGKYRK